MLPMLKDLLLHKEYANASLLKAIRQHEPAAEDLELRKLLHHIILANRYWLFLIIGRPFAIEEESRLPESLGAITALYREIHAQEGQWIARLHEDDLTRALETRFIPGLHCSLAQAIMQVCLHSQGHRAQCASRIRSLGGVPPALDFILWLKERPSPDWE